MDTSTGITPVMPLGSGTGFGADGNAFIWIFGLLILMSMFNGGAWGNNGFQNAIGFENLATSNEVQRGFDAQNSIANEREILSAVNSGTAQAVAATNQTFHDTASLLSDKYSELQRDIAGVAVTQANALANQNQCCCETRMDIQQAAANTNSAIQQNRYEAALNTASINENTTAQTQKILDAIQGNRIADLQNQVNQLQLAQATNGMLKFPNSWTYGAGPFPPIFGCGCGQNV